MIQFAINKAYFLQALHTTRRAISSRRKCRPLNYTAR